MTASMAGRAVVASDERPQGLESSQPVRLLFLEDSDKDVEQVRLELHRAGMIHILQSVSNEDGFNRALREAKPELVLLDCAVPEFDGRRALMRLRREHPELPVIIVSGTVGEENAVEMMRLGAVDFVPKLRLAKLAPAIQRARREAREQNERRLAESELRNSESRFRAVFEGAGTGIAVEDLNGRIIKSNRALQHMLGYAADELQNLTRHDFTHARDHQEDDYNFKRLLSGQSDHYQAEKRFVRKDGRIFWGRLTVSMVRDDAGRPQFPIMMIDDVTERQRAEDALLQYAAIVESSNDAIVSATFDGVIFSWNPGAERIYGYTEREANGHSLALITPADKEEEFAGILERIRNGERIDNFETVRMRRGGERIHVSITTSPIKDATNRIIGASSISRDITERKRAEEALRESEENYRKLVELAPDAIFIISDERYVFLNSAGVRLFGASSPADIIGKTIFDLVPSRYHDLARKHIPVMEPGKEKPLHEEKFIRIDGSLVEVEATAIPFSYRGREAFQVVIRDITERKRALAELRKSEARLARAQQIAHLGSWERDLRSNTLTWSEETCRIFGLEPGRFAGTYEAFLSLVHPEDRKCVEDAAQTAMREGGSYNLDHRIIQPGGKPRTVNEQGEVLLDEKGVPTRLLGTVLDITERKASEMRIATLSHLGERLSTASTPAEAARIIADVSDNLFGWDACNLVLCSLDQQNFSTIFSMDLIDGVRTDIPPSSVEARPSERMRKVIEEGAQLILRPVAEFTGPTAYAFGNKSRPSASLMYVPVRNGNRVVGIFSIQSYTLNAYTREDLSTLQALADHCAGAIERIRAETENRKLAAFPQFNPNPVMELREDGGINYFNEAALQMAESLGQAHPSAILPSETGGIVKECLETGQSNLRHETIIQHCTISWMFFPIRAIGVVHCYARDITQRKKAETLISALSRLGQRLSSAATARHAAGIIADMADDLFGWDACNLDLCTADQLKFATVFSVDVVDGQRQNIPTHSVHEEPSPRMRKVMENGAQLILRENLAMEMDTATPFGDVTRPSASIMYAPVRNGTRIIGVVSIHSYMPNAYTLENLNTLQALADHCGGALERIRAEAENQKLAAFPQFNPNPVLELAEDGSVNYYNESAKQMAVSLGKEHPKDFLPPETQAFVRECLATEQSRTRFETMVLSRTISWSFFPIRAIGVVHCYAVDVTERQNLETQLRQSQKMESVGQLAGGIAHDFNNILTVIQGHTTLLSMSANLSKESAESAQQIGVAAERAANLTRQLLTFSRRQVIQPKNLDLNEVVHNMTKMLRRLLGEDVTLHVSYGPDLPLVQADPGMMEQVILNLAVNARDAMPKGGRLFVNTSLVSIDESYLQHTPEARIGKHVCLLVRDTGTGIAPEHLARIFEPFFTTKDVGRGTGLGLATVYGIVQQHRGWIRVSSTVGKETVFEVFLPAIAARPEPAEAKAPELKVRGGRETILVVEDEVPLRVLVKNVLERYGYKVLEAGSGLAAIGVWVENREHIDLLLTDMVMPHGLSGRELAERLQREKPNLKVIFSSGYSLAVVGTDMVLKEGLNFLQKPYHPRKLAQAVRDCMDT